LKIPFPGTLSDFGIGILAMGATNSFIGANFILGQANLTHPSYTIERWHTVLVAYLFTLIATFINMWGSKILDKISKGLLVFNIVAFITTITTILACNNNKQPASDLGPLWLALSVFCSLLLECVVVSVAPLLCNLGILLKFFFADNFPSFPLEIPEPEFRSSSWKSLANIILLDDAPAHVSNLKPTISFSKLCRTSAVFEYPKTRTR
jgi:hypothetical protein